MSRQILRGKLLVAVVLCLSFVLAAPAAYAWGGRYYHHGGRWYNDNWFWFGAGATALTIGAIVASMPQGYRTVYVSGVPYYYYNDTYFVSGPAGYVVVPPPIAVQTVAVIPTTAPVATSPATKAEEKTAGNNFEVRIPNDNGSYTMVVLRQTEKGFLGPQGEFYTDHPTVEQLKEKYVKK